MLAREAAEGELPAVLALLAEDVIRERDDPTEVTAQQRAAMAAIVAHPDTAVMVVVEGSEVVAAAQVWWLRHLIYDGGLVCQLESVRTASAHRSRGIGTALMEHVLAEARRRGAARVQLTTNRQRSKAIEFYQRLGFVPSHVGMKHYLGESR